LDIDFLTFDYEFDYSAKASLILLMLLYLVAWLRKRNGYSQDFKTSPVTVATLASDKGTLKIHCILISVPFNVFRRKRKRLGIRKKLLLERWFYTWISLIIQLNLYGYGKRHHVF
jgi:hypothetical protein